MSNEIRHRFRSMATDVSIHLIDPAPTGRAAVVDAERIFERVATACTRFDPTSALMTLNASPKRWQEVPAVLVAAIAAAATAHEVTEGRFDPRVLESLQRLGYAASFESLAGSTNADEGNHEVSTRPVSSADPKQRPRWRPRVDRANQRVKLGRHPIDLGGIGKGLAVSWAAAALTPHAQAVLVEAGGDVHVRGRGPEGDGWRVAVENPAGGPEPLAVLHLQDGAVATSSIRIRRWQHEGRQVHHLIDPRTGEPADSGLQAVTVVDANAAAAEVWSKALFVEGRGSLRQFSDARGLAALWVDDQGWLGMSAEMRRFVLWRSMPDHAVAATSN